MPNRNVTTHDMDEAMKAVNEALEARERALVLLSDIIERIDDSVVFCPGMLGKIIEFVETMKAVERQDERFAALARKCAERATPLRPN